MTDLLIDPAISRAKFDREIAEYRKLEDDLLRRGWMLLKADFPEVFVVFANPKIAKPRTLVFGVVLDFTNYDIWPASVRIVDPLTREPYKASELPTHLPRKVKAPESGAEDAQQGQVLQALLQNYGPDTIPFLCLPGVREYHNHPGHTGDSWLLHRTTGEGKLHNILEQLYRYGVEPLDGFQFEIEFRPVIRGFAQASVPQ